jgi:hypothetical protein
MGTKVVILSGRSSHTLEKDINKAILLQYHDTPSYELVSITHSCSTSMTDPGFDYETTNLFSACLLFKKL